MTPKFCSHIAVRHHEPKTEHEYLDNIICILNPIQALFEAIDHIDDDLAVLAILGAELCSELRERVTLLGHHPWQPGTGENDVAS